jgi:hypothetical protein
LPNVEARIVRRRSRMAAGSLRNRRRALERFGWASVIAIVLVLIGAPSSAISLKDPVTAITVPTGVSETSGPAPHLVTSCLKNQFPLDDAFDPANGYVYIGIFGSSNDVGIVKPPCTVLKAIPLSPLNATPPLAWAYDPITREMVGVGFGFAWVFEGTSLVKRVNFIAGDIACNPSLGIPTLGIAWDPALDAMLISNSGCGNDPPQSCGNGGSISLLYMTKVSGITKTAVIYNAFDCGNQPEAVFAVDGYVFSAGLRVDVFNDRTLGFLGSFPLSAEEGITYGVYLTWDPLNQTVLLDDGYGNLYFLDAHSVATGHFTYSYFALPDNSPAGGVTYSYSNQDLYIGSYPNSGVGPAFIWLLSSSGALELVKLHEGGLGIQGLTYDPTTHYVYACGLSLFVIS